MSKTEFHEQKNDFNYDNEEEIDHRLRKQIRQLEGEHKVEKAVLEQKIELLEMRVREFEERETDLKKKNSEILQILSELNRKEDSALMNKVFEELELANNEKLQEKLQQHSKIQAVKDQLELNINELKKKLEQSEGEKQELEARFHSQLLKHQRELEQERRAYEEIKKELEEKMHTTRRGEELDRLRKMSNVMEEEKEILRKEYEKEMNKMKFGFERNLAELKKIHNEERHSFENRLKKVKDLVIKERKEHEAKAGVENQLSQEITQLKEKIVQIESKYALEVEKLTKEKNVALEKVKELEKSFDEFKSSSQGFKTPCNNTERFMRHLEERLRVLEQKEHVDSSASKAAAHPAKEESRPASRNALHDSQSEVLLSDPAQCWTSDEHVKTVYSKPNTRTNSRNDLISQPQSSTYCYSEVDNHTYAEKGDSVMRNDSQQDYLDSIMDDYSILKDTSQLRGNLNVQNNIKRQNWLTEEKHISYTNDNSPSANLSLQTPGKEAWNYDKLRNIGGYKSPIGVRVPVNYPRGVYLKSEGPSLRRNGSQGQLGSSLRRDLSSEKLDMWRDSSVTNITTIKDIQQQYDSPYKKGIQDVISGLSNIKSRLEKQQHDTLVPKTETSTEMSRRTRSFSNVRLRPSALPSDILNTTSFYNESNYRPYEHSKIHVAPITTTNMYLTTATDENTTNLNHLSQYGELSHTGYSSVGYQPNSRPRMPALKREGVRIDFQSRHRNSLA